MKDLTDSTLPEFLFQSRPVFETAQNELKSTPHSENDELFIKLMKDVFRNTRTYEVDSISDLLTNYSFLSTPVDMAWTNEETKQFYLEQNQTLHKEYELEQLRNELIKSYKQLNAQLAQGPINKFFSWIFSKQKKFESGLAEFLTAPYSESRHDPAFRELCLSTPLPDIIQDRVHTLKTIRFPQAYFKDIQQVQGKHYDAYTFTMHDSNHISIPGVFIRKQLPHEQTKYEEATFAAITSAQNGSSINATFCALPANYVCANGNPRGERIVLKYAQIDPSNNKHGYSLTPTRLPESLLT